MLERLVEALSGGESGRDGASRAVLLRCGGGHDEGVGGMASSCGDQLLGKARRIKELGLCRCRCLLHAAAIIAYGGDLALIAALVIRLLMVMVHKVLSGDRTALSR